MKTAHILTLLICGLGVIHGFILGLYLLLKKDRSSISHKILGLLLIVFGIRISKSIFLYFTVDLDYMLITLGLNLILLLGPLFYFYTKSYLKNTLDINGYLYLHGIPFIVFLIGNSFQLLSKDFYVSFGIYIIYLHFLTYIISSFVFQRTYLKTHKDVSTLKKQWLQCIHIGIIFIWASYFFFLLGDTIPYILGPLIYSIAIYFLSLWALSKNILKSDEKKYQNSSLSSDTSKAIFNQLEDYFQNEQPFLNPDLKLQMVASVLKVTPHSLSQAVNENNHQNFQQFLNRYRIQAAQEMLAQKSSKKLTISSIAYDCGFNSISAFNTAFKKITGQTPSQFRATSNLS